ncbi:glycosyltransferase family 4 protein [Sphingopyxis sp. GW247-27LB]|uniref:glycosyltransferase family 4 protein n=1 Tax=Sphingopyxis sp. GW247-27LB TaxID=2012632 RepID=UPI000BA693AD|nr:glycosyltransferase family 4 protein [Sphingopyxis sp. GW247-27LB]PAL19615.1 glycosyltransferase family 1 protein [Sphingopyxis sp. GW247-27LB]
MQDRQKSILFFVGDAGFFVSHRLNLVAGALRDGYRVTVACPRSAAVDTIRANGADWVEWKVDRGGTAIFGELLSLLRAFSIVRRVAPTVIHAISIKCILHAGLASKFLRVPIVGAVSGLGYVYIGDGGGMKGVLRRVINAVMNFGLNRRDVSFIFQNGDDARMIEFAGLDRVSVHRIGGSGVDLNRITMQPHPPGPETRVGLPARLLRVKGVYEFVEAARELRGRRGRDAKFLLIGDPDLSNPSSITPAEIEAWTAEGVVEWVPHTPDVASVLATLHIVALPADREGFPKTLIDAAAAGRAAVTSDVPGCRDAIAEGVTGLLCPVRNALALADTLDRLIVDRDLCVRMGIAARAYAEENFDIDDVTRRHIEIYRERIDAAAA